MTVANYKGILPLYSEAGSRLGDFEIVFAPHLPEPVRLPDIGAAGDLKAFNVDSVVVAGAA